MPQILPAPAKPTVLVPLATPVTQTVGSTSVVSTAVVSTGGSSSKVPMVQLMPKSSPSTVVSKMSVTTTPPGLRISVSSASSQAKTSLPHSGLSQQVINESPSTMVEPEPKGIVSDSIVNLIPTSNASLTDVPKDLTKQKDSVHVDKPEEQDTLKADLMKTDRDNNTSSEDDSLLVCSETIDSGAGLHDAPLTPEEISPIDKTGNLPLNTSSPEASLQNTTIPAKTLSNHDIDNDHEKSPTAILSQEHVPTYPEKTNLEIPDSIKFVEDFLNELDSVRDHKEKTQSKPCEKIPSAQDNKDFEICKKSEEVKNDSLQDLKNLGMDNVKDFDAVSSFLQSFVGENMSEQNAKDLSQSSSVVSGLDSKELKDINQGLKSDQGNEILAESKLNPNLAESIQEKEDLKMTLQANPESSCLSGSFDINDISLNLPSSKSEISLQSKVNEVFALEKIPAHSNKVDNNLKDHPQNSYSCSTSFKESLSNQTPDIFVQSSVQQSLVENSDPHILKDSVPVSVRSEQTIKDLSQGPVSADILGNMLAQSSGSGEHEHGLTESERLALEAIANVRTSGRKRKPPSILTLSPPRQTSGWIRGALRYVIYHCKVQHFS